MNIFTLDFTPPKELIAKGFCLFPTNTQYFQSDYEAVMNNKEMLRAWGQSSWPEDNFTALENKEDLARHVEDNSTHAAYGYMIYSLDRKICYGSVYVNPLKSIPDNYFTTAVEAVLLQSKTARIDYWVIQENPTLEKMITLELKNWFHDVWKIHPLFSARKETIKRIDIYEELGFHCQMYLKSKTSEMTLLLF